MPHPLAQAHRRIATAEHGVENALKRIASRIRHLRGPAADRAMREEAEMISRRADIHLQTAERIDHRDQGTT